MMIRPAINNLGYKNQAIDLERAATQYWLCNINGDSYYLQWDGNGWVVRFQESYMDREGNFNHKSDIKGFAHSNYGDGWDFVFETKEAAVAAFCKKHEMKGIGVADVIEK